MLKDLKKEVYLSNMELKKQKLVIFTWGNVSGIDRKRGLFVIKPSGVSYDSLKPEDMVVMDLEGNKIEGKYNPSSDTKTHLALYNKFETIGGVAHTHSTFATSIAQAGIPLTALGTTHADYFYGDIPITRDMTEQEINSDYEFETGNVIIETFEGKDPMDYRSVLVKNHGPFTWGVDARDAVHNAVVLEEVSKMFIYSSILSPGQATMPQVLLDKHYLRKHGKDAYYGQ
ncbi:MAG: L-ribulose-5-phosphate 4-epimerase [Clostridiales bacterium]|jgi:L-ribulose-5-phosphate 4-epimerase|nr:L-ribulose-5-phosphate 4-epimerase [Clostridiales bacterium]